MVTKPTDIPFWAVQDQTDPVSGQNNVLVPPPEKQQYGWNRLEFPPRNWFNWLARLTYQWIQWFDQQESMTRTLLQTNYAIPVNVVDVVNGGMALINAVDQGNSANFFAGMAYIPPGMGSPATVRIINSSSLIATTIDTSGGINFTGAGVNVLVTCQMGRVQ